MKPKIALHPIVLLVLAALFLAWAFCITSCIKSNITFKHRWKVQEGHDKQVWSHATFCDSIDYGIIDTIELNNTAVYDSTKFGEHVGSIYLFPGQPGFLDPFNIYDRYYCVLLEQLD